LREVLVLTLVRLEEYGFDLCSPLVIALKLHPDLSSSHTIRDSFELRKRKTREKNTASNAICVVLIDLILNNVSFKHNIISILTNLPNFSIYPLKMCGYVNLPIGVVYSIKERWFAETLPHAAFVNHGPIKVE
jgi:hypothetical protein